MSIPRPDPSPAPRPSRGSRRGNEARGATRPGALPALARARLLGAVVLLLGFAAQRAQALPAPGEEDGFHWAPSIYWQSGDQRLDLTVGTRYRVEWWQSHIDVSDASHALRTRVAAKYSVKEFVTLFAEFQDARLYGLSDTSSGLAAVYRTFSKGGYASMAEGQDLRQAFFELRPVEGLSIRGGRTDIKLGTQFLYPEPNWKYLQIQRASQRLVGTVGWSHAERSNDAGTLSYDTGGHHLFLFGGNPTTGVFDLRGAYQHQGGIVYGGASWTIKRGTWLANTEIRPFFLAYHDDRRQTEGGLARGVEVYSFGFSGIGIYPCGPGNFDLLVWAAGQGGDYDGRDHWAGAGIVELGYQLPEVFARPWLRAGVNVASGGGPDGDHNTFFNMLPTNHLYYGFADQLAFQNLLDILVQLKLEPHERVGINLMVHHFRLVDDDDFQYFGTGAFTKKNRPGAFGFGANPSGGYHEVGTEFDAVIDVKLYKGISAQGGYAKIWGGDVFEANFVRENVEFGYLQLTLQY